MDAFVKLQESLKADPDYAWAWHCNAACCSMDEGLSLPAANRAASRFMMIAFGVDTTSHEHFEATQTDKG